jgi:hypothetical protein
MFGLVIGIDCYLSKDFVKLQGCKKDAQSMLDLLWRKFHIRPSHFLCLADESATRSAILDGFRRHLIENSDINHGDAIVIFYAGHGSCADAPAGWIADNNQVETICPHDERTRNHNKQTIYGIPDRTIGGLLRRLAHAKGDNIVRAPSFTESCLLDYDVHDQTMISDSCHSGGHTRAGSRVPRQGPHSPGLPKDLDKHIWTWGLPSPTVPSKGFLDRTMASHVLIAACRHDEVAFEGNHGELFRGAFTRALVKILEQEKDLNQLTYLHLLDLLPETPQQHPQCGGKYSSRVLFDGVVGARPTTFKLRMDRGIYRAAAGEIHGVVKGTIFAVHTHRTITTGDKELGVLEADHVDARSCTLRGNSFDIPDGARALVLNWRQSEKKLRTFIEPPLEPLSLTEARIGMNLLSIVDSPHSANLVVRRTGGDEFQFERLDPLMSKYSHSRILSNVRPTASLPAILRGIARFNFHLFRRNSAHPLMNMVNVVLHRLKPSNLGNSLEELIYIPDADIPLVCDQENVVSASAGSRRVYYGLTVKNNSGRNLFPFLMYFNPTDYSTQVRFTDIYTLRHI